MSIQQIINYDNSLNFSYDTSLIEFVGLSAHLKLITVAQAAFSEDYADDTGFTYDNTKAEFTGGLVRQKAIAIVENYLQAFAADTGFTYDSALTEFAAGLARQKNQRLTDATFGATYTNNVNGSWGNGVLTGTAVGGAAVSGGKLDLTGGTIKYVSYSATSNADNYQTGTIKFKLIPDWTGVSVGTQCFFDISRAGAGDVNSLSIRTVSGSSDLNLRICNSLGNYIVNANFGGFSAVSGQQYEFQLNYDLTTGATRLYVDGVNIGGVHAGTGTRSGACDQFYVGTTNGALNLARFKIDDFEVFSSVQAVVTGYTIPEADYLETVVTCPIQSYLYNIASFGSPTITEVNAPKYVVNGYYWNGAAWAASSNTYATAMTLAQWQTNVATFPSGQFGTGVTVKVIFQSSNTLSSIDNIAFDINETHFLETNVTCPTYTYSGPGSLLSIGDPTSTEVGAVRWIVNGYYWNGSAFALSDDSYAQSTSKADWIAHLDDFIMTGVTEIIIESVFPNGLVQCSVANMTFTVDGEGYSDADPAIIVSSGTLVDALFSFSSVLTASGSDGVKFQISVDAVNKYWSGAVWATSDGTYAQSNTYTEINTNIAALDLSAGATIKVRALLHSDDSTTTPSITSVTFNYDFFVSAPTAPEECAVWAFLSDILGEAIDDAVLVVELKTSFEFGDRIIARGKTEFNFDADGRVEASLVKSADANVQYYFSIEFVDLEGKDRKIRFNPVVVPDQDSISLNDLTDITV